MFTLEPDLVTHSACLSRGAHLCPCARPIMPKALRACGALMNSRTQPLSPPTHKAIAFRILRQFGLMF